MGYLELSTKYDKNNYKSWHNYALLNYKYFDYLYNTGKENKNSIILLNYANNSIHGFTNSVCIGGKNISKTLQDLLRLIDVWFIMGDNEEVDKLLNKTFNQIDLDSWLLVIPQLLARVNIIDDRIKNSLVTLLKNIGNSHPRSLIYPLIVMNKARSKKRRLAAESILQEMKKKYNTLIEECSLIIDELNRCALLLHEEWGEAIEESAKLYFQSNDIKGMIKILMEVHGKMDKPPETMNEIHFHQIYASDLNEAGSYLKRYIETLNEMDLKQAWDIYHTVFKSMNESFTDVKYLDLENVSPKLYNFKESEICVPGLYKSGYPVIKIRGFEKQLSVYSSKQHPRKIIIHGSDGKEYMFLLKGHEDLRQDERAMQLFGLVNTLLANDTDTASKNLFIKRFPVIPLSHNTGIIGWVPNCDTLHQLIKEYRNNNKIIPNVEYRLMFTICPKFETVCFLNKLEVFKYALQNTLGLDLYKILWKKSKNSEVWLDRRTNYSRSLAVMSMVGYILGLGDRHPSNLMLDRNSGKIIHIDFGDCFEVAMKREKFPERVPFRLTRMLIKALEVSGIEGTFRITCENVMRVLRANKDSLIAILAAFVHDPLISFRLLIPLILKATRTKKNIGNTEGNYH
jgi:FKBP12-rapamycin complex-associated protein